MKSSNRSKHYRDTCQIATVYSTSICTLIMGSTYGWPAPSIIQLVKQPYNISIDKASYLTIIDSLTLIVAAPIFAILADKIGRRPTMAFVPLTFMISILITIASNNIYVLYVSRFFSGLCQASCLSSVLTYIGEVTTPKIRSAQGHVTSTALFVGQFLTILAGLYLNIPQMGWILLSLVFPGFLIIYFLPESPYYYIMKNELEKGRKSLIILRQSTMVEDEFNSLVLSVRRQLSEASRFKDLFTVPSNRKATIVCLLTRGIQHMTGVFPFIAYCQYMFEQSGIAISSGYGALIFIGMFVVTNPFSNVVCDKLGKRIALISACSGITVILLGEAIYFYFQQYTNINLTYISWFPVFNLAVFVVFFCMGPSNIPSIFTGELFSASMKPYGVMFINMSLGAYIGGVNKLFQYLMSTFGLYFPFLTFAVMAFISIFLCYFFIPETNGKTLEEIQFMLKRITAPQNTDYI